MSTARVTPQAQALYDKDRKLQSLIARLRRIVDSDNAKASKIFEKSKLQRRRIRMAIINRKAAVVREAEKQFMMEQRMKFRTEMVPMMPKLKKYQPNKVTTILDKTQQPQPNTLDAS